jgi:ATP-dependent Clp endopeptidase proteolytic subunit ClpP
MSFLMDQGTKLVKAEPRNTTVITEPKVLETIYNRIYFYSEIDRSSVLTLNKNIRDLCATYVAEACNRGVTKPSNPIYLHIQSYGGSVFAGLAAMDEIINISRQIEIHTIIDGCCASAATFLSIVGTRRYINKHAFMLIHQLSSMMWGKYEEMKDEMLSIEKIMKMVKDLYAERTKLPTQKIEEILQRDIWFTADECLQYGLVDEII